MAGAAVAAKKHHDAKESEQAQQQPEAPAATPAEPSGLDQDAMTKLGRLGELHEQGVLTDGEFAAEKAKLLGG